MNVQANERLKYRVLTIAREYGSGGAEIAQAVADRLGWELLDRQLILQIARVARVDPNLAGQYDERLDSWLHRLSRSGFGRGGFEAVAAVGDRDVFDAHTMAALARDAIAAAYSRGRCVIVGRGGQCVLQDRADVFHVFVYAPWAQRVARIRERIPDESDVEGLIRSTEKQRADFIREHFKCERFDPHLYHMLITSGLGVRLVASLIVDAMRWINDEGR